jgi:carbon-monoxide dehydrogenase medium subunit
MKTFDYHTPSTVDEALSILAQHGDDAHFMAGGTSMMLLMSQGLVQPGHVVGLRGVTELRGIKKTADGGLEIGAMTSHRQMEKSDDAYAYCPTLPENFARVATIRIRNQGTVGGNLVHADPAQDPPSMLMALDAQAVIRSGSGERTVGLDEFFTDYFETVVQEGELLTSVKLPPLPANARTCYVKFLPRTEDDYATVAVAARLQLDSNNKVEDVRVALGAAAPTPIRAKNVENAIRGQVLTEAMIDDAAALVLDEVDPIADIRGSAEYKRAMARVWTQRALKSLLNNAPLGGKHGTLIPARARS